MMTTVEEVNSDKTKVLDEFIFRSVLLDCFTAKLDVSLHVSFPIKLYGSKQTLNWVPVFMF